MRVVGWYNKTDHEDCKDIEDQDTPEDALGSLWNVSARVLGLGSGDRDVLDARVRVNCVVEGGPKAHELSKSSRVSEILYEGTRVPPVLEANALVIRATTTCDNEGHDVDANDEHDL